MNLNSAQNSFKNIPLKYVSVFATLILNQAAVRKVHKFVNEEDIPVEVIYKFPIPENAAVYDFKIINGSKVIQGIIEEKEEAYKNYDEQDEPNIPYILEQESPNVFTLYIRVLEPKSEIAVEICFAYTLNVYDSVVRFFLPTEISPSRFSNTDEGEIPLKQRINPGYADDVPYRISLKLDIPKLSELSLIESPTHNISVIDAEEKTVVEFYGEELNKDIIINIGFKVPTVEKAYIYKDKEENVFYAMSNIFYESSISADKNEIIFLLDYPPFISEEFLSEIKQALSIILRGLNEDTLFNIYTTISPTEKLFKSSQKYSELNFSYALDYINKILTTDITPTNKETEQSDIISILKYIFKSKPLTDYKRKIYAVTDSLIGDVEEAVKIISANNAGFYILGAASSVNDYFLKAASVSGNGAYELISYDARPEKAALRLYEKMVKSCLDNIKISAGSNKVIQSPVRISILDKETRSIFAKISSDKNSDEVIPFLHISCSNGGTQTDFNLNTENIDMDILKIMWANSRIKELETDIILNSNLETDIILNLNNVSLTDKEKDIINLSKKYNLMSSKTDFIAVEENADSKAAPKSKIEVRKIQSPAYKNMHYNNGISKNMFHIHASIFDTSLNIIEPIPAIPDNLITKLPQLSELKNKIPNIKSIIFEKFSRIRKKPSADKNTKEQILFVSELLNLQSYKGGFELTKEICKKINFDYSKLKIASEALTGTKSKQNKIFNLFPPFHPLSFMKKNNFTIIIISMAIILAILEIYYQDEYFWIEDLIGKSKAQYDELCSNLSLTGKKEEINEWAKKYVIDNFKKE
jgi:Ca-activated chloride channel family protein